MKDQLSIIPVSSGKCQEKSWKTYLKEAIKTPEALLAQLQLTTNQLDYQIDVDNPFKTRVPQPFIDKMAVGNPNDPLLLQVIAQQAENLVEAGYSVDPLEEQDNQTPGLLHKYYGRVLLILSSACAVNCRYCFRRHFPYEDQHASGDQLSKSLEYISENESITEVILSGGDPLIIDDNALAHLVKKLESIKHVKRLRIHTRLPVVIPQRVTSDLCGILRGTQLQTSMVLHINHANEIDALLQQHLQMLNNAGVVLLNQSVLLKKVNDNVIDLSNLSEKLFESKVMPYYLHLLDKVAGATHFDIEEQKALSLLSKMRSTLPGYLVPKLAKEEANHDAKTVIS
jgi:EF-P beta-lysylation protein EpmB